MVAKIKMTWEEKPCKFVLISLGKNLLNYHIMFDAANLPAHFSSLILLTKTPSLIGDPQLVKEALGFFQNSSSYKH